MVEEKTFYCWHQDFTLTINGNSKYRLNNLKSLNRLHFVLFLVEFPTRP